MSSSNCCFLIYIKVSQEAGQMVWYSRLFQNFPQVIVIHTVKGFGIGNQAEINLFLELSSFFDDPADVGNLISCSSALSKTSLNIWKLTVHVLLKPGLENFEHYFTSVWDECNCVIEYSLVLPFFGVGMRTDLFQSYGHCWVFQICWHIECSTFTASPFRIWNSSTGIPSSPLALFVVMLPKAHLTSHSRMSGSRWVIMPSWLSGSWRSFLYSSSVYSCHLYLISSASIRSILFLSFINPLFAWNIFLVSLIFLKRSWVFSILLFSSIFLHWLLGKAFLSLLALLWSSAFKWVCLSFCLLHFASLLTAICKASSDSHFAFFSFLFLGDGLDPCLLYNVTNLRP